jgi:hypothetical protein
MVFTERDVYGLIPSLLIAVMSWFRLILILNQFVNVFSFTLQQGASLFFFLCGGVVGWVSEMSIRGENQIALQICSATYRTFMYWLGFLLLVNNRCSASRQQLLSLLFSLAVMAMWELQHRLILA